MSAFVLKIIACFCMLCDHFGDIYFSKVTVLNYIGRIAFTIFAFQIAQGYIHTHDIKKYIKRLLIFALISQIPYMTFYYIVFHKILEVNVIFTLLFGILSILVYDKYDKIIGLIVTAFLATTAELLNFDYGAYGVLLVFMFYILKDKKALMILTYALMVILKYITMILKNGLPISYLISNKTYLCLVTSTFIAIIPILLYNGKKGKDIKYLVYFFYPIHLMLLEAIMAILGRI